MTLHRLRLFGREPLLTGIVGVPDEFFLFRIDRDHGKALRQGVFDCDIDVPKRAIVIGMLCALLGLPMTLKAIVETMENWRDLSMTYRMLLATQFAGNHPCALPDPQPGRLGDRRAFGHQSSLPIPPGGGGRKP